jgi:broad specificity phosphatase PhoE
LPDGSIAWADSELTPKGVNQALATGDLWKNALSDDVPAPERYFASPLRRCIATAHATFSSISLPDSRPFSLEIRELVRECIGVHTCDRRSSHNTIEKLIAEKYPDMRFSFEDGFSETDPYWNPDWRESHGQQVWRMKILLDALWEEEETWLSLTSHSGSIVCLQEAVGLPAGNSIETGTVLVLFVKGVRVEGKRNGQKKVEGPIREAICDPSESELVTINKELEN